MLGSELDSLATLLVALVRLSLLLASGVLDFVELRRRLYPRLRSRRRWRGGVFKHVLADALPHDGEAGAALVEVVVPSLELAELELVRRRQLAPLADERHVAQQLELAPVHCAPNPSARVKRRRQQQAALPRARAPHPPRTTTRARHRECKMDRQDLIKPPYRSRI
eukprot:6096095-Pyramimonas_sp.AAC.2